MINSPLQKRALDLMDEATDLVDLIDNRAWPQALDLFSKIITVATELGQELSQESFNDGLTKKEIAERIGIDPRTFRGMEKTR